MNLLAQRQLDIQGDQTSTDTVATIQVNSNAFTSVVGLGVHSEPQNGLGVGGIFYGGFRGIEGQSTSGTGIYGSSSSGTGVIGDATSSGDGVYGSSASGAGIFGTSISGNGGTFFGGQYGVHGTSASGNGGHFIGGSYGVYANSPSGTAVYGKSDFGKGAEFYSNSTAVYGESESGYGGRFVGSFAAVDAYSAESIGGYFTGGAKGIVASGGDLAGVDGTSSNGPGGFFYGGAGVAIELGGADSPWGVDDDDCVLRADEDNEGSDLILVANDIISFHLDDDTSSTSAMLVYNDINTEILRLNESGNLILSGTCSCSSDFSRKEKITSINTRAILEKVSALPITEWQFKGESTRHLGPMAQDFYAAFGLGADKTTIATVDADGIALAAIKALKEENDNLKERLARLEAVVSRMNEN